MGRAGGWVTPGCRTNRFNCLWGDHAAEKGVCNGVATSWGIFFPDIHPVLVVNRVGVWKSEW